MAYEYKCRDFLKLGLIAERTAVATAGVTGVAEIISEQKGNIYPTQAQKDFMINMKIG